MRYGNHLIPPLHITARLKNPQNSRIIIKNKRTTNPNLKVRRSMRNKYLKQLIYVVIPIITVFLCRLLKVAQGEKNEEIVFGIMLGILLDIIFFIIQKIRNR